MRHVCAIANLSTRYDKDRTLLRGNNARGRLRTSANSVRDRARAFANREMRDALSPMFRARRQFCR